MTKVLVTGFEPFGGEAINPALEAVHRLSQLTEREGLYSLENEPITLVTREIPTVFHRAIDVLRDAIFSERPDLVICVGQAGGRSDISIERVAINVDDARIPDNAGGQPVDQPIFVEGPVAYWSSLPIKAIAHSIREAGIPASVSQTAGTFVCNHLFYGLCHLIATECPETRGGFIHIPFLPEQAAKHPGQPSMSLDCIVNGLRIAVTAAVSHMTDLVQTEGQIS